MFYNTVKIRKRRDMDLIIWIALYSYGSLLILTIREKAVGQNTLTWTLWTILDIAQYYTTESQQGDSADALKAFSIGGIAMVLTLLLLKSNIKWGKTETTIIIAVPVCTFLWLGLDNPKLSLIGFCAAQFIAGIPLIKETKANPEPWYIIPNLGFIAMNIYYLVVAKSWQIKDVLLSEVLIIYGLIIQYYLWRELFKKTKNAFTLG